MPLLASSPGILPRKVILSAGSLAPDLVTYSAAVTWAPDRLVVCVVFIGIVVNR